MPGYLHLHPNVDQSRWTEEFSQYDAGWLHLFDSGNEGEIRKANWDDLNYPARLSTLAAAGLPMLQKANDGAVVATQTLTRQLAQEYFSTRWMSLPPSYETESSCMRSASGSGSNDIFSRSITMCPNWLISFAG